MAIVVRKLGDDAFEISGSGKSLRMNKERFEDIFFAIPEQPGQYKNETEFFRHLTDNICEDQAQRDIVNYILAQEGDNKLESLRSIQDQVRGIGVD